MNCETIFNHAMNLIGVTVDSPDCDGYAQRSLSLLIGIFRELAVDSEHLGGHKPTDGELNDLRLSDPCPIDSRLSVTAGFLLASQLLTTEDPDSAAALAESAERSLKNALSQSGVWESVREVYPL